PYTRDFSRVTRSSALQTSGMKAETAMIYLLTVLAEEGGKATLCLGFHNLVRAHVLQLRTSDLLRRRGRLAPAGVQRNPATLRGQIGLTLRGVRDCLGDL